MIWWGVIGWGYYRAILQYTEDYRTAVYGVALKWHLLDLRYLDHSSSKLTQYFSHADKYNGYDSNRLHRSGVCKRKPPRSSFFIT